MSENIYIYSNGNLKRNDNTIQFVNEESKKRNIPIERISDIYIFGEVTLNTKLINFISQKGISLHFFNYYGYYSGTFNPREKFVSGFLIVKQVEHYSSDIKRLNIAKEFVNGAANNIYRNLRYYNGRGKNLEKQMAIIKKHMVNIDRSKSVSELMGVEGNIHKEYYDAWNTIIDQDIDFEKRVKRPPDNMINTMISFVNTLVYTTVVSQIYLTQLNPIVSYLHQPGKSRFSLSLDISEIFKPLIGDRMIFSLLNKNQIKEKHFIKNIDYLHLTKEGSQIIMEEYNKRLKKIIRHKELGKEVSYKYLIKLECYKIIKHLIGEKNYDSFKIWW